MERSNRSPVMGYKIAIVNNANLNNQFVTTQPYVPAVMDGDVVITPAIPEKQIKQFEYASKRLMRAVRKARKMAQAGNRNIMLFGQRENGEHFAINYRKPQYELSNESARPSAQLFLSLAKPGTPIEDQRKAMTLYRVSMATKDLIVTKDTIGDGPVPDELVDRYYRPKKEA